MNPADRALTRWSDRLDTTAIGQALHWLWQQIAFKRAPMRWIRNRMVKRKIHDLEQLQTLCATAGLEHHLPDIHRALDQARAAL